MMLREIGARLELLNRVQDAQHGKADRPLNPNGRIARCKRKMPLPPRTWPPLARHIERNIARAAVHATFAAEGLTEPFVFL